MDDVQPTQKRGFSGLQVLACVAVAVLVSAGLSYWFLRTYVYAPDFEPVSLSLKEQRTLDQKLLRVGLNPKELLPEAKRAPEQFDATGRLIPEPYAENSSKRNIKLDERELNALLASNGDLAKRFAIDLSAQLASAKILIPVDPEMPVLGGKTLRVSAGLELSYHNRQPIVILRGISVMGVPIPNAWLGNLKNVDLVAQFGGSPGLWQSFAAGIESIDIKEGAMSISLKE
jgi:hypothetical protein